MVFPKITAKKSTMPQSSGNNTAPSVKYCNAVLYEGLFLFRHISPYFFITGRYILYKVKQSQLIYSLRMHIAAGILWQLYASRTTQKADSY